MKKTLLASTILLSMIGGALAQSGNTAPRANTGSPSSGTVTGSSNPAVNTSGNAPSNVNASGTATIVALSALEKGANSFTQSQAQGRLEGAGFTGVSDLKKDDQGIWRGKAMRAGKSTVVGFDYKGNIGAE
jgi:protein CpxP